MISPQQRYLINGRFRGMVEDKIGGMPKFIQGLQIKVCFHIVSTLSEKQ